MSANQFPVWTCSFLMKFSQLLVPSHSSTVLEYNYTQNAYSSFCLPAAYSVRCMNHEAEEMRSLCLYLSFCQSAWLCVRLPLRLSWIGWQWHDKQVTITQLPKWIEMSSSVVYIFSFFSCLFYTLFLCLLCHSFTKKHLWLHYISNSMQIYRIM